MKSRNKITKDGVLSLFGGEVMESQNGNGRLNKPVKKSSSFKSAAMQAFVRKLESVYGYQHQQIISWVHLPASLRRLVDEGSCLVFRGASPYIVLDNNSEKAEDAIKRFHSYLETLPETVRYAAWTNGLDHVFLFKSRNKSWREVPDLPRSDEDEREVGHLLRRDLVPPETLILEFNDIRNHLAANAVGVTRDEVITREVLKLLFCKIHDERHTNPDDHVGFYAALTETPEITKHRLETTLLQSVFRSGALLDLCESGWTDTFELDADSICYTVGLLQRYEITKAKRDIIGQAFESLIGPTLRGEEGQFFTPRNVVQMAVAMVAPKPGERVIDPACGSGGFLAASSSYIQNYASNERAAKNQSKSKGGGIFGLEKDSFLATLARLYMAVSGEDSASVFCEDSLKHPSQWKRQAADEFTLGSFDVLITNPPFGAKIPVKGEQTLGQYQLAKVWKKNKEGKIISTDEIAPFRPPQVLFIERCLDFLKVGGRMAIVLPDGILGNVNDGYVRQFLLERADLVAVVDCPLETFLPSTPTKTSLVVLRKKSKRASEGNSIFMAVAEKCGHDRRGKPLYKPDGTPDDDFPIIATEFSRWREANGVNF